MGRKKQELIQNCEGEGGSWIFRILVGVGPKKRKKTIQNWGRRRGSGYLDLEGGGGGGGGKIFLRSPNTFKNGTALTQLVSHLYSLRIVLTPGFQT